MKQVNKGSQKDIEGLENYSLTREAALKNKSKWEMFLEGYKNHYKTDFSWSEYIKKCKLYYGDFDIKNFIDSYGPECEEDFKRFRADLLAKRGHIKKSPYNDIVTGIEFDEKILELMVNGDNLRTRMLISFLNPQTREEKKKLKKSWKKAKKQKQSRAEWMKTYVGIPFKPNELDPLDTKYTRDEIFEMIRDAKKRLNDLKFKKNTQSNLQKINLDIQTPSRSVSVSNINELENIKKGIEDLSIFQPTVKFDALTKNTTKNVKDLNLQTNANFNLTAEVANKKQIDVVQTKSYNQQQFDLSNINTPSKTTLFKNFEEEDAGPIIIQTSMPDSTHELSQPTNKIPNDDQKEEIMIETSTLINSIPNEIKQTTAVSEQIKANETLQPVINNEMVQPPKTINSNHLEIEAINSPTTLLSTSKINKVGPYDEEIIKIDHQLAGDVSFVDPIQIQNKIRSAQLEDLLTIEKSLNEQLQSIQEHNARVTEDFQKASQMKLEEEKKYEMLRKQREELTRTIQENEGNF